MRFCTSCGEGYHGFCFQDTRLPECVPVSSAPGINGWKQSHGTVLRCAAEANAHAWKCEHFMVCRKCGIETDDSKPIILCEHCERGVHLACLDPPLTEPPKGNFFCDLCDPCQLCAKKSQDLVATHENLFCSDCDLAIRQADACTVYDQTYPHPERIMSRKNRTNRLSIAPAVTLCA